MTSLFVSALVHGDEVHYRATSSTRSNTTEHLRQQPQLLREDTNEQSHTREQVSVREVQDGPTNLQRKEDTTEVVLTSRGEVKLRARQTVVALHGRSLLK